MEMTRNTIQRNMVYNAVRQLDHPTAEEIFSLVSTVYQGISRGTVYRNLNVLTRSGKINKVQVPDSADHFDWNTHEHKHFFCRNCGKISDTMKIPSEVNSQTISLPDGFVCENVLVLYIGLCPNCKK